MQSNKRLGRPKRTFTEEARRAQIIECAIDALAELGYGKTSLAQIAKRADISTSVVSYYFAGKDDLMREVIATTYGQAAQMMAAQVDPDAPAREILRSYIESNVAFGLGHARELKALSEIIIHWLAEPGKLPAAATPDAGMLAPLEEILRWGQETGEFRTFDPRPMAITIRNAIDSALEQSLTHPGIDMEAYTSELTTLFDLATRKSD